jgi:hypothetical protein
LITTARVPIPHRGQVDVFAPEVVVWAYEGPPQLALRAMLELVHPAHPLRPLPPIGRVELSGFVGRFTPSDLAVDVRAVTVLGRRITT